MQFSRQLFAARLVRLSRSISPAAYFPNRPGAAGYSLYETTSLD